MKGEVLIFRIWTYFIVLLLLALFSYLLKTEFAFFPPLETWSMILGYLSFVLIGLTLLIGPVKQWLPPAYTTFCLKLRRDLGILAGAAGVLHVAIVLYLFETGNDLFIIGRENVHDGWLGMFFSNLDDTAHLYPNTSKTGIANYLGAVAFFVLLALWLTSSRRAELLLGGAGWKRLHLQNPLLFLLVLFHGVIYIQSIKGHPHTLSDFLWLAGSVFVLRGVCFVYTICRRR
ncbi:ferric reductase-like transmembrane domain-containing protein [Brevibacillus sp. H7]|uniref:ferric reductase-like transmembrane domain-containing protein n=1 Tax=Brevibacillus sp. H7 TaxID=3349138 RepID=UPI00380775D4